MTPINKIKRQILAILVLPLIIISCNQPEPKQSDYPDSDAIFLNITHKYVLNEDGSMKYYYSKKQKLFSYMAFTRLYGETFIKYNSDYQSVNVEKSETIMADGKKLQSPKNAYNLVLQRSANYAPAYNNLKELVVTHVGLEKNSIINCDYTINTKKNYQPFLMDEIQLQLNDPIKLMTCVIEIPSTKELQYQLLNNDIKPIIKTVDNKKIYKFIFKDIPATIIEPKIANKKLLQKLIFTTAKNPIDLFSTIANLPAFTSPINDEIKNKIEKRIKNESSDILKVLSIQNIIANNINYYPVPFIQTPFKIRTPNEVWNANGGTAIEKAALLTALYKSLGYNAKSVYPDNTEEEGNFTAVPNFSNVMVKVILQDNYFLLSPISTVNKTNLTYNYNGRNLINIDKDDLIHERIDCNSKNNIAVNGVLTISGKEIKGKIKSTLKNSANPYYQLLFEKTEDIKLINDCESLIINKLDIENSELTSNYKKDLTENGDYYFYKLPVYKSGINSWGLSRLSAVRTTIMELPNPINEEYDYLIKYPSNYEVVKKDISFEVSNEVGSISISINNTDKGLEIKKKISIENKFIQPNNYLMFKELMNEWHSKKYNELIFKK